MVLNFNNQWNESSSSNEFGLIEVNQLNESYEKIIYKGDLKILTTYDIAGSIERIITTKKSGQLVFIAEFENDIQVKNETYHDNGLLGVKTLYNLEGKPISEENYDKYGNIISVKTFSYYKNGNIKSEKIEDEFGEHEIRYYKNGQIAYQSKNGKSVEYDELGLKTKSIDLNGNVTRYKYDENGIKIYEFVELKYYV